MHKELLEKAPLPTPVTATFFLKPASSAGFGVKAKKLAKKWATEGPSKTHFGMRQYNDVRLYDAGGDIVKNWYFEFYYLDPQGQRKRKKFTADINRFQNEHDRRLLAAYIIKKVNHALATGELDPNEPDREPLDEGRPLVMSLEYARDKIGTAKKKRTREAYDLAISRLNEFLQVIQAPEMKLLAFKKHTGEQLVHHWRYTRNFSPASINNSLSSLRNFFEFLVGDGQIRVNPLADVKAPPKTKKSVKYKPFSDTELQRIFEHLSKKNPLLNLMAQFIYTCFIRPVECCGIYRRDINFQHSYIAVSSDVLKTGINTQRQVFPDLLAMMREMGIDKLSPDELVFGPICGIQNSPETRRKEVSDLWKQLVKEELGIKKDLYALKHTGNIHYILNNPKYDILWLQQQNGHTLLATTQIYLRDLGVKKLAATDTEITIFGQKTAENQ